MKNIELYNETNSGEAVTDVCELQNALQIAQQENTRLKEANKIKDELMSVATHQIRGPLGAIRGYASLLKEGDYGELPSNFIEPLDIILKSSDSLQKMVNDLLADSQIGLGVMRYYRKDFDFSHLVTEVINEMRKSISPEIDLRLDIPHEVLTVHGDKAKLKQVLLNLVDNAGKYTKEGWIEISVRNSGEGKVIFSVRDSGVGIKPETMPLLFQKFSRCSDASKSNIHGTGLGLYVAKRMLEAHNGRIWAESEGESKGSQFYVELDLVK
jgi:signal transduction histidine kinase